MTDYRTEIETAAAAHDLDPDLVQAIVEQESGGWASAFRYEPAFWDRYLKTNPVYATRNPREVSSSYGLMQIMFATAVDHGFTGKPWDLFDPAVSLEYGCRVLQALLVWARSQYTGLETAAQTVILRSVLAAYNGGKSGNAPKGPLRNREYADDVMRRYRQIQER
jgi:soluble lytic murein transglycosylase-like protein